jgi:DHA3 family tetracycline resistance protein-like MFS transporter
MLRSLAYRPFALLWAGQSISRLGDSFYRSPLSWWVLEKTGFAAVMGAGLVFLYAPMVIFTLVGGVAVDRFSRLKIIWGR